MKLSRALFRAARISRDLEALSSGKPQRIERREKNKIGGRALAKVGSWRWLWR